jgi:mono/diheme cytochrome c family protein
MMKKTKEEKMGFKKVTLIVALLGMAGIVWGADGAALYAEKCVSCHGAKGEGSGTGPPHKGNPFVTKGNPADIKKVIMEGRSGEARKYPKLPVKMPKGLATSAEADDLVKFLQGDLQN